MLTTLVTIVGLLPLMFQLHPNFRNGHVEYKAPGSEWWVQLSGAVVWDLAAGQPWRTRDSSSSSRLRPRVSGSTLTNSSSPASANAP